MNSVLELRQGLQRLSGPVEAEGVWASIEARANDVGALDADKHGLKRAVLIGVALLVVAGGAAGIPAAHYYFGSHEVHVIDVGTCAAGRSVRIGDWTRLPLAYEGTEVLSLELDAANPTVLYACTPDGLFRSDDAAATWARLPGLTAAARVAVDPTSPSTLYVTSAPGDHLWRSLDSGATWTDVAAPITSGVAHGFPPAVSVVAFDTSSKPSTIYVTALSGSWKSMDEGETWTKLSADGEQQMYAIEQKQPASQWLSAEMIGDKLADPTNPAIYYRSSFTGVWKSTDGGKTWQEANHGLVSLYTDTLVVDPSSPSILYAATPQGIAKSVDAGETWTSILGGGAGETAADNGAGWYGSGSVVVSPSSSSRIYLRTPLGLFRSDNGGVDLTALPGNGLPTDTAIDGVDSPLVLVATDNPAVVFVRYAYANNTTGVDPSARDGIYRSSDAGETWERVLPGGCDTLTPDPQASSTLYTLDRSAGRILKSVDDGATWSAVASGPWNGSPMHLFADGRVPGGLWVVVTKAEGNHDLDTDFPRTNTLLHSADGGSTWHPVRLAEPVASALVFDMTASPQSGGTLYAMVMESGSYLTHLCRSTDSGATWVDLTCAGATDDSCAVCAAPGSQEVLYVAGPAGVFRWSPAVESSTNPGRSK